LSSQQWAGGQSSEGEERRASIFCAFAEWASNTSNHLFVEDRVILLNSARKQVYQLEKKAWLMASLCISKAFQISSPWKRLTGC
jgi:hypothetical protein